MEKRLRLLIQGRKKPQLFRWEETTSIYIQMGTAMHARPRHRALGCVAAHGCLSTVAVLACRLWRIRARRRYAREHDCAGRVLALTRSRSAATRALAVSSPCSHHAQARPHRLCSPTPATLPRPRSASPPCSAVLPPALGVATCARGLSSPAHCLCSSSCFARRLPHALSCCVAGREREEWRGKG